MGIVKERDCMKKLIVVIFSFIFALCLCGCGKDATSIGIIGGADGPTVISVASDISWLSICGLIIAAIIVALVIYLNKKKKQ